MNELTSEGMTCDINVI